jgi:phospho-N-acetylmuramoyl-pentapeptide-transferase
MIYHLLRYLQTGERFGFYAYQYVMFRSIAAVLTSVLIAFLIGPKIIRWLMRKKIGDRPEFHHAALNELTKEKANTPTMGGLIIIFATLSTTLLWVDLGNSFIQKAIILTIWFAALGGVDDWLKLTSDIRHRSRSGLRAWEKLIFQIGGAVLIASFLFAYFAQTAEDGSLLIEDGIKFWLPFYKTGLMLANWMFVLIAVFYLTATSNAVNLADGMDGLAAGCVGIVSLVLVVLCYVASEPMGPITSGRSWAGYLLLGNLRGRARLFVVQLPSRSNIYGRCWVASIRRRNGLWCAGNEK